MNSIVIILGSFVLFFLGYHFYANRIVSIWKIDPARKTPAFEKYDGIDYIPSKNWFVLFGHHFASIAGAGPIIGPIIALTLWGWVPALIWIIFGSIFIGGIHDFGALITSIREDGATVGDIAEKAISRNAKIILSIFIWFALILVIAVFAYLGGKTFVSQPKVVLPSFGIIPIAFFVGLGLYHFKWSPGIVTLIGLLSLGFLIYLGERYPIDLGENGQSFWIKVLLIYCFFASIIPVNILLQPRDYLSSFLLFAGIFLALGGIFISQPTMHAPAFIANTSSIGPIWPMMFITVACGANSGFHSLVASGTTSKQIANESHAKRIGFGGMLLEGVLATIVVILVVGGLTLPEFNQHIVDKTNPVIIFGDGFGNVTRPFLGNWGTFIALTILNVFILTTLDSATRITRYVTEELFSIKNRYFSTFIIIGVSGWLALGKDSTQNPLWQKIWPVFGASNQLVAALALLVITCWLLSQSKPTIFSLVPAIFMLFTSLAALCMQAVTYWQKKEFVLISISLILLCSSLFLTKEVLWTFKRFHEKKK